VRRALLLAAVGLGVCVTPARAVDVAWSAFGTSLTPGWYVSDVWINWTLTNISPPLTVDCPPVHLVNDTTGQMASCSATDASGTTTKTTTAIRIDRTPPSVVANADRLADAGGFYNHALTAQWSGTDATSGVAACTSTPYSGPDGTGISLTGTCKDKAGNLSAPLPLAFNYDATPPVLADVTASADDGGARLAWQASGAARIMVTRSPGGARAAQDAFVYDGAGDGFTDSGLRNGRRYTYLVQALDTAGNTTSASTAVTPSADASTKHLLSPGAGRSLSRPPLLRWRKVARASYYNVQLFRNGKKILSTWPTKPQYQLRSKWRYRGKRHRLVAATYQWLLWAGYGHRSEHRYGKLLGKRTFIVR
jgi:hypothetical protein